MRPRLVFHCQHTLGLGHLVRSLILARSLAERFDVVLLAGGVVPSDLALPPEVEVVALPPLGSDTNERRRAAIVLETFHRVRPAVVVVELFPFGRKKLAGELLPLLAEARRTGALAVCSVRDILVQGRSDQAAHDERAASILNTWFDAVVVHADARLVRLGETFRPRRALRAPVHYSGFVAPTTEPHPRAGAGDRLLVSAGGGRFGGTLLRAALLAQPEITARSGLSVRLVAGPFLGDADRRGLARWAEGREGVELVHSVPDLASELASARVSLSQCGYNTALDLLRTQVPALVVPFSAPGEDEQVRRAKLLERLGVLRVLSAEELRPRTLARLVASARPQRSVEIDLDGAARTRDLLVGMAAERMSGAA